MRGERFCDTGGTVLAPVEALVDDQDIQLRLHRLPLLLLRRVEEASEIEGE